MIVVASASSDEGGEGDEGDGDGQHDRARNHVARTVLFGDAAARTCNHRRAAAVNVNCERLFCQHDDSRCTALNAHSPRLGRVSLARERV